MRSTFFLFIMSLSVISAGAAENRIIVRTQLCELATDENYSEGIAEAGKTPETGIVTLPERRVVSGQWTNVSRTREVEIAGKGAYRFGAFLSIRPTMRAKRFDYSVNFKLRELEAQSVQTTMKIADLHGTTASGSPVYLDLGVREEKQRVQNRLFGIIPLPVQTRTTGTRLVAVLTFERA